MSKKAWSFVLSIIFIALLIVVCSFLVLDLSVSKIVIFLLLTTIAIISQIYEVDGTFRNTYYPHSVFFLSGAVLLDPFLFSLLVIIPHSLEWLLKRIKQSTALKDWYIQPYNISTHILAGLLTSLSYQFLQQSGLLSSIAGALLIVLIAFVYTVVNHLLIGIALLLARKLSFYETGVMKPGSLLPDVVLGCLGYMMVLIWQYQPFMLPLALAPVILMYESLKIPQLTRDAQIDAKTSLLNAKYFSSILTTEFDTAVRHNTNLSILMTDLDLMRNINNTYGHLAGDVVLAGIGKIIRQVIPDQNHAGRFGGEEFAILLSGLGIEEARRIAESIRKEVEAANFIVDTHPEPIKATLSIGVAAYPYNAKNSTELIYAADIAVYQAKRTGRNRVIAYSDLSKEEILLLNRRPNSSKFKNNEELILQLRQGLDNNQFVLYYQPIVDIKTGQNKGIEALVRWNHPERGMVPPGDFIPAAEESGLIMPLGKWVLEEALKQVKVWNTFLRRNNPIIVSVNFSAVQFQREDVVEIVTNALRETGTNPAWLEIEITEGVLMDNTAYTVNTLKKLKEIGIRIAMDDFGIGYSSLSYLRNFPIDTLKIDRSFVTSLDKDEINQALIQAIIMLARKLKFTLIAEGVETEQERRQLITLGCSEGQGYYFARPMPALAIDELLSQERSKAVVPMIANVK